MACSGGPTSSLAHRLRDCLARADGRNRCCRWSIPASRFVVAYPGGPHGQAILAMARHLFRLWHVANNLDL
jgi:hypothetical protein